MVVSSETEIMVNLMVFYALSAKPCFALDMFLVALFGGFWFVVSNHYGYMFDNSMEREWVLIY